MIAALNAIHGRPRLGLDHRHMRPVDSHGINRVRIAGRDYFFQPNGVMDIPCVECWRDTIGATAEGSVLHMWKLLEANQVMCKLDSSLYYQVRMEDVKSITPCVMFLHPQTDGSGIVCGQYNATGSLVWDLPCLPETYEDYFQMIGCVLPEVNEKRHAGRTLDGRLLRGSANQGTLWCAADEGRSP